MILRMKRNHRGIMTLSLLRPINFSKNTYLKLSNPPIIKEPNSLFCSFDWSKIHFPSFFVIINNCKKIVQVSFRLSQTKYSFSLSWFLGDRDIPRKISNFRIQKSPFNVHGLMNNGETRKGH